LQDYNSGKVLSDGNCRILDPCGGVLIRFWKGNLDVDQLCLLEDDLEPLSTPRQHPNRRGTHTASYLGNWRPRGGKHYDNVYDTPTTRTEEGQAFIQTHRGIWKSISKEVKKEFPHLVGYLKRVPKEHRKFGLFSLLILNHTNISKYHQDVQDFHNGICVVFGLGDGQATLSFPHQNTNAELRRGDLIAFRSSLLLHGLDEVQGERKSGVLTTHNNLVMKYLLS